ncbi:MAG TPA: hypothetical protein VGM83_18890 [Devosiaceae bacterium]
MNKIRILSTVNRLSAAGGLLGTHSVSAGMPMALAMLMALALPAEAATKDIWDGKWITAIENGSTVELPSSVMDGLVRGLVVDDIEYGTSYGGTEGSSFAAEHYWLASKKRPYVFMAEQAVHTATQSITYSVDHDDLGVMSGYLDADSGRLFYNLCRTDGEHLQCLDMNWSKDEADFIAPLIDHIVASFKLTKWLPVHYPDE